MSKKVFVPGQPGIIEASEFIKAAVPSYPNPVAHPLGPPTMSGTTYSVDLALQQPTRVTRTVMDLTLQRFFADRVFTNSGGVTGGAVVYDVVLTNDIYLERDIGRVAPGGEFPIVTSLRRAPQVAAVEKWGGKFFVTDEARDRNDVSVYTRHIRQLANTIVRKINQRAVEVLNAAVTANSRTATGHSWGSVITTGSSATNANAWPAADFAAAQYQAEVEEMGVVYDLWVLNPAQYLSLATIYGNFLGELLDSLGLSVFVTNRVAAGTAFAVAEGQVGQMRIEQPLATETWRDADGRQQTWTQTSVRPVMFVDNPLAVIKFSGLT
jgi:hypothetical protein